MTAPLLRRATPADAESLCAIGRDTFCETFGHMYPPRDLEAFLQTDYGLARTRQDLLDPTKAAWLLEADGRAVGHALAGACGLPHPDVTPACGELKRLYVLKSWQNGGAGTRLFLEVLAWLERAGPRSLWIGVWSENHGAQRFYARHGFAKVGEYEFKVGDTHDRELILRRAG
jgi:GNAT superfamily N-acetyltransferase